MKYKKIILLTIIIVSLFAISAVSATDNTTNDIVSVEETISGVECVEEDNQVIESVNDIDYLNANSEATFSDLANEIGNANGELNLTRNYVYNPNKDNFPDGIVINKQITINGNGFTIDGNKNSRAFNIESSDVILNNIKFSNCFYSRQFDYPEYVFDHIDHAGQPVHIIYHYTESYGGAVYWAGKNGVLSNCSFVNNSIKYSDHIYGGAVYWTGNNGVLSNCSFINNSIEGYYVARGGAVYWEGGYGVFSNCSFVNNSANAIESGAGAFHHIGVTGVLSNCSFANNTPKDVEGIPGFFNPNSNSFETLAHFVDLAEENSTLTLDKDYYYSGWEIAINKALTIDGNNHTLNGLNKSCIFKINADNVVIKNINFVNGYNKKGNSVFWNGNNGVLSNCRFMNTANSEYISESSAVYWHGSYGVLSNCTFMNNYANSIEVRAGAVYWDGNNGVLSNCSFINNSVKDRTVYWKGSDGVLSNCSFVNNSVKDSAVYWYGSNGVLSNCSFMNNFANSSYITQSSAVYWHGSNGVLSNCSFVNNSDNGIEVRAGAVYWEGSYGVLSNCSFVNNSANAIKDDVGAGAVYWIGSKGVLSNCSFVNNTPRDVIGIQVFDINSNSNSFARLAYLIDLAEENSILTLDKDYYYSGSEIAINKALTIDGNNHTLNGLNKSRIFNVKADNVVIKNIRFVNGYGHDGGAVYWHGNDGVLSNCSFMNNSALEYGGAVCWYFTANNGVLANCSFMNNFAHSGGAVCWYSSAKNGILVNCSFVNNCANSTGGAIRWFYDENYGGVLRDCMFLNNTPNHVSGIENVNPKIVKISTKIIVSDVCVTVGNGSLVASLNDNNGNTLSGLKLTVRLNSELNSLTTGSDGKVVLSLGSLSVGNYTAYISFAGNDNYNKSSVTSRVIIKKADSIQNTTGNDTSENKTPIIPVADNSKIIASTVKVTYAAGSYYIIKVNGTDGKPADGVTVKISGKISKTLTTKEGVAKFKVTQVPGTYKLNITALNKSITKKLTVKHLVTLKSVTVKKSAKKLVLQATLGKVKGKYLKAKSITFKFNGKKYKAKTNKKGVAKVTIKSSVLKKLKVGKKVTYQATYLKDTVKKTVKVKK